MPWRLAKPLILVLVVLLGPGLAYAADRFVFGIDDMPLMPGLRPLVERSVMFDAPGGRIVESYAEGAVARDDVRGFYARTLPQLGWRETGIDRFVRESETLRLEFPDPPGPGASDRLVVRFFLSPG